MYTNNLRKIIEKFGIDKDYTKQEILDGLKKMELASESLIGKIKGFWNFKRTHRENDAPRYGMFRCGRYGMFRPTKEKFGYYHFEVYHFDKNRSLYELDWREHAH